jgi:hypothetical protein
MSSYASFNVALSFCMIMAVIALLVGRSPSFDSPHFVLSMSSTRATNSQKPSCANVSTINSYAWYLQAIPNKFSCATFKKKPSKSSSTWGRSGRICYLPYCLFQKRKKEKKKGTPPWYVNVGGHPMESVIKQRDKNWLSLFYKSNFYLSVLQMKSSSTYLITASLCEGPFFYFYVESPPSIFMHRLREHSCHSEYNVHCSKVFID